MSITFTSSDALTTKELELGTVLAPKFDANGLVTAVAIDAQSREILMLAHMNAEALALSIQTGKAHYYSRSRQSIWKKGETSGEVQAIVRMRVDCDQDAIIIEVNVEGRGAACHTGRVSCFFREIVTSNSSPSLEITGEPPLFDPKEVYSTS